MTVSRPHSQFPWLKSRFGGAPFDVRGARNLPCITVPGKRAPTAKMCESNEYYVPLNDGYNWRGDPNATLSGQPIPQLPPGFYLRKQLRRRARPRRR